MPRQLRTKPQTRDEKWLKKFTEKLARDYGFEVRVKFSQRAYSFHSMEGDAHLIAYGEGDISRCQRQFCEYKTWRHLWPGYNKMRGQWALWGLVIHEFAHAIQREDGYRMRGSVHNLWWAKRVKELQSKYTFIDNLVL